MKKQIIAAPLLLSLAGIAYAQSSVTLYGIVDAGIVYRSNERVGSTGNYTGHSNVALSSGNLSGSRWGLKGTEQLGNGWSTLFQLENGFDTMNGTAGQSSRLFGRQAFVGLSNTQYGTLTMGRQYTSLTDFVGPVSPVGFIGGIGAHPGDIDDLDQTTRVNNSVKFASANYAGFTFGALYGFGGQSGSMNRQSTWSVGAGYANGPLRVAAGFERADNSKSGASDSTLGKWSSSDDGTFNSSINEGYASARTQQIFASGLTYDFGPAVVGVNYSNVQYRAGANSLFTGNATFNIAGVFGRWRVRTNANLFAGYSYTHGNGADGVGESAQYHSVALGATYDLSKRSTVYLLGAWQHASGETLNAAGDVVKASASAADKANGHSAAGQTQTLVSVGLRHRF